MDQLFRFVIEWRRHSKHRHSSLLARGYRWCSYFVMLCFLPTEPTSCLRAFAAIANLIFVLSRFRGSIGSSLRAFESSSLRGPAGGSAKQNLPTTERFNHHHLP